MKLQTWDDYVFAVLGIGIVVFVLGYGAACAYAYLAKREGIESNPLRRQAALRSTH